MAVLQTPRPGLPGLRSPGHYSGTRKRSEFTVPSKTTSPSNARRISVNGQSPPLRHVKCFCAPVPVSATGGNIQPELQNLQPSGSTRIRSYAVTTPWVGHGRRDPTTFWDISGIGWDDLTFDTSDDRPRKGITGAEVDRWLPDLRRATEPTPPPPPPPPPPPTPPRAGEQATSSRN